MATTLIFLLAVLFIYRRWCYIHEKTISVEYKNRVSAALDRMRMYAIEERISIKDHQYRYLKSLIEKTSADSEKINVYYMAFLILFSGRPTDADYEDFNEDTIKPIMQNEFYKEIYYEVRANLYIMLYRKHFLLSRAIRLKKLIKSLFRDFKKSLEYKVFNENNLKPDLMYSCEI